MTFDIPFEALKSAATVGFDGDQLIVSQDQSKLREGAHSMLRSGQLWVLAGNQPVMKYWSHNVACDAKGNFLPRDEADPCSIFALCEDNTIRMFGSPLAARGTLPVFTLQATINMMTGAITPSSTGGIVGTLTNDSPTAGSVGEIITATAAPAAVALTTAVTATVTSITLTPGHWQVTGVVNYTTTATTSITQLAQGSHTVAATLGGADTFARDQFPAQVPTAVTQVKVIPTRLNVKVASGGSVIYYLVARGTFTASTLTAGGTITAMRVR